MITVRPSNKRGQTQLEWLDSRHSFSFGDYYDPDHMGFRQLRVINEDRVAAGQGFGTHPHRDMEILTYVVSGALAHQDSMGNSSAIRAGEVQRMSAGTGITHSEFNASRTQPVHLLQIWILPEQRGLEPSYEQHLIPTDKKRGRLFLVAAPDGGDDAATIHQDVKLYAAILAPGEKIAHRLAANRHAWLQVVSGTIALNRQALGAGDGAAVSEERQAEIDASADSEFLLFDLA